jgi:hypothetical protein
MKTFTEFLAEGNAPHDVHKGLAKLKGLKEVTHAGMHFHERKYSGISRTENVSKVLKAHGWTKTSDHDIHGHHTTSIYHPPGVGPRENPHAQVHHRAGKVFHIHFEYRQPND